MKKKSITIFAVIFALFLAACTPTDENNEDDQESSGLTLTSLSPSSKVAHMPSFTLTAAGTNFVNDSVIVFNGTDRETTFVSSTELTCLIEPGDIVTAAPALSAGIDLSSAAATVPVLVRNPAPESSISNTLDFTINSNHTFYVAQNLSALAGKSYDPAMVVDNTGNINVAWGDKNSGHWEIYFSRSTDKGSTWSTAVNVSNTSGDSQLPAVAIDNDGGINLVWRDNSGGSKQIYFSRSTDSGVTWTTPVNISNTTGEFGSPDIAVHSSGNIVAAWHGGSGSNSEIYFNRSPDKGNSWTNPVNVSNNPGSSGYAAVSPDGSGGICIVWQDISTGTDEIYFSRSTDKGKNWSSPLNISKTTDHSNTPAIAVDNDGDIYVTWGEYREGGTLLPLSAGNYAVCFSSSSNNGTGWSTAETIFTLSPDFGGHDFTIDSAGNINLVYSDYDNTSGNWEIYFSRSIDKGASWSGSEDISDSTGDSLKPVITVDETGNINVAWMDKTPGNYDIFYTGSTR